MILKRSLNVNTTVRNLENGHDFDKDIYVPTLKQAAEQGKTHLKTLY